MNGTEEYPLAVVFSGLAKAAEKQQTPELASAWNRLAERFDTGATDEGGLAELRSLVAADIDAGYPTLNQTVDTVGDRGMKRALTWGEKVTKIQKSLVDRYLAKGDEIFEGKELFVCEACGFVFLGTAAPDRCPVCKAPSSRFSVVK